MTLEVAPCLSLMYVFHKLVALTVLCVFGMIVAIREEMRVYRMSEELFETGGDGKVTECLSRTLGDDQSASVTIMPTPLNSSTVVTES